MVFQCSRKSLAIFFFFFPMVPIYIDMNNVFDTFFSIVPIIIFLTNLSDNWCSRPRDFRKNKHN